MEFEVANTLKTLTQDNLFEPDAALAAFLPEPAMAMDDLFAYQEWMAPMFDPQLPVKAPAVVRDQFETSRSLFCYGYFYSPLYVLGVEKLFQALEWALILRCDAQGYTQHELSWRLALDGLDRTQTISSHDKEAWETLMLSRYSAEKNGNAATGPTYAISVMTVAARLITALYPQ